MIWFLENTSFAKTEIAQAMGISTEWLLHIWTENLGVKGKTYEQDGCRIGRLGSKPTSSKVVKSPKKFGFLFGDAKGKLTL